MAAENKSIPSLYALKTLAAFFVVVIHFPMLGKQQLEPLVRTAVPLFYIITGFFLYKGTQEKEVCTAKHWVKKGNRVQYFAECVLCHLELCST